MFKNTLLVIASLLSTLVVIEVSMRLVGGHSQEKRNLNNQRELSKKADFTIVTLGESTTDDFQGDKSWPRFLGRKLEAKGYSVRIINLAESGAQSGVIINKFLQFSQSHEVDIVVSMLGVNDRLGSAIVADRSIFSEFKLYKLYLWITDSFNRRKFKPVTFGYSGYDMAEIHNDILLFTDRGFSGIKKKYPNLDNCQLSFVLTTIMSESRRRPLDLHNPGPLTTVIADKAFELCPQYDQSQFWLFQTVSLMPYLKRNFEKTAESVLENYGANLSNPTFSVLLTFFRDDPPQALEAVAKLKGLSIKKLSPEAVLNKNFSMLVDRIEDLESSLVVMGYPTRPLQESRQYFKQFVYEDISYVENRLNFEEAVDALGYDQVFIDRFAHSWGHTSAYGHELIADQVLPRVVNILESRKRK